MIRIAHWALWVIPLNIANHGAQYGSSSWMGWDGLRCNGMGENHLGYMDGWDGMETGWDGNGLQWDGMG